MLPYHGVVYGTLADEEFAPKVVRVFDEAGLGKAFRIGFGVIHVAFPIHDFVPFPVYDRTARDPHLEDFWIVGHEAYGHESSIAPAMYADAVFIHIGEFHEAADAHHLVFHFFLATLPVDGLFKGGAPVFRSPVVLNIDQVAFLGHQHFPHADISEPAVLHHLAVRAAIDIEDDGIFPGRVEVLGVDEPIVIFELAVGAGDGSHFHLAGSETLERVSALEQDFTAFPVGGALQHPHGGRCVGIPVDKPAEVRGELNFVPASFRCECNRRADFGLLHGLRLRQGEGAFVQVILHGGDFSRGVVNGGSVVALVLDVGGDVGDAAEVAQGIDKIKAPEAVTVVGAVDEKVFAAFEEPDGVQGLYPGFVVFGEEGADPFSAI